MLAEKKQAQARNARSAAMFPAGAERAPGSAATALPEGAGERRKIPGRKKNGEKEAAVTPLLLPLRAGFCNLDAVAADPRISSP